MYNSTCFVYDSTVKELEIQQKFLDRIGSFEPFKLLFDLLPNVAFYIKDLSGRIMVINRWNCKNCNVPNEMAVVGKTSYDLFPAFFAEEYFGSDMEVMNTGRPILNKIFHSPDYSTNPLVVNKVPIYDRNHEIMGVAMMCYYIDSTSHSIGWDQRLADVIDYIHCHYTDQLKNETLTQIAGVSETHLKRVFNQLFGMPPIEYVILTRINEARNLLEITDRTVSDIAQEVGFYDHSHFIRHFKRIRGCTPNQYRKQLKHQSKRKSSQETVNNQ